MTRTKKSIRFITVILLAVTMLFSFTTVASAAGVETWYGSYAVEPSFTFSGSNLTPTKTMGVSGTLYIDAKFTLVNTLSTTKCILEVRDIYGNTLAHCDSTTSSSKWLSVNLNVSQGQRIHVYMEVYDYYTGATRTTNLLYTHAII